MRRLRELLEVLELLLRPLLKAALVVVPVVVILIAVAVRRACACSTVETGYAVAMRVDLLRVAAYHEARREQGGSSLDTLPPPARFAWSTGVQLVYMRPTSDGFIAELSYPDRTENRCRLVHVWGAEPKPACYWMRQKGRREYGP